jgi:hypothetical protein
MVLGTYIDLDYSDDWHWHSNRTAWSEAVWMLWMSDDFREHAIDAVANGHSGNRDFDRSLLGNALKDYNWEKAYRRRQRRRLAIAMAFHWRIGECSPLHMCPWDILLREIMRHIPEPLPEL